MVESFEKPLTMESMGKFIEFLKSHGFEPKEGNLEPNPEKPQRAYTLVNGKRAMSGYYAYYDNFGTPIGFASDYRTGQTHTSNYLEGNLPRSTTRLWNNSENRQSKTKNKNI
jgi:hypothetical protein